MAPRIPSGTIPRQIAVESDLEALDAVAEDDPLVEELAARYLVP
jgi:hypothetical protein